MVSGFPAAGRGCGSARLRTTLVHISTPPSATHARGHVMQFSRRRVICGKAGLVGRTPVCRSGWRPQRRGAFHRFPQSTGDSMVVDQEKLAKLQAASRVGGKGAPRRKVVKKPKGAVAGGEDKKLQAALKKLAVQPITGIEEVNMFKEDGNVLHIAAPKGTLRCP